MQNALVDLSPIGRLVAQTEQNGRDGCIERGLSVQIGRQHVPVLQTYFEYFHVVHVRDEHQIAERIFQEVSVVRVLFDQTAVLSQEARQEEAQVLNEVLLFGRADPVRVF